MTETLNAQLIETQ